MKKPAKKLLICLAVASGFLGCRPDRKSANEVPTQPALQARAGGEGLSTDGFDLALPGRAYSFPRDHAAHPRFATEWWYYTGGLRDASGRTYGYQLTFFRVGVTPPSIRRSSAWAVRNLYFAHMAVTDDAGRTYHFHDRISRGSLGEAGARTDRYDVHIGNWSAHLDGNTHVLAAIEGETGLALRATPTKPPVIHGQRGISQKSAGVGRASYYYSYTRMATRGTLTLDGIPRPVTGLSWFDHEFGSNQLSPSQVGWDWFSLQLDDDTEAMLYVMRTATNRPDPYSSGTLVDPRGKAAHLRLDDYRIEVLDRWRSPASGATYPAKWRIRIPGAGWDIVVEPTVPDQELRTTGSIGVTYWEGRVQVTGTVNGKPVRGEGYVELTGYAQAMRQTF